MEEKWKTNTHLPLFFALMTNLSLLIVIEPYGSSRRGNLLATLQEQIYSGDFLLQHCDKVHAIVAMLLQVCEKRFPMGDRVMQICEKEFPIEETML